jgi:sulfonate transport system substrate-binding protein
VANPAGDLETGIHALRNSQTMLLSSETLLSRRRFLKSALVAGAGAVGSLVGIDARAQSSQADLRGVSINVLRFDSSPENFFADAGIPQAPYRVNLVRLNPGSDTLTGLASGALDLALTSQIPPVLASVRHLPVVSVAVLQRDVDNNVSTGGILVHADGKIRRVHDLKGKRVAYLRTAVQHYVLIKTLASAALTLADIEPVALTNPDSFGAFKSGSVDAWSAWGTMSVLAQERFGARILVAASTLYNGYDVLSSTTGALSDPAKRAALVDHLRRCRQFYAWREANPQAWARAASRRTGVDEQTYLDLYARRVSATRLTGVDEQVLVSQRDIVATFREANLIDRVIDPAAGWDAPFGKELG